MPDSGPPGGIEAALDRPGVRSWLVAALVTVAAVAALTGWHRGHDGGIAAGAALLLVGRAVALGRPLVGRHLAGGASCLVLADLADTAGHVDVAWAAVVATGVVVGLPRRAPEPADADERRHVWSLVDSTPQDAIAPFALRLDKSYVHTPDRAAAVAYRVRFGTAVASGDPVGDPAQRADAVAAFLAHADAQGWRAAAIGVSDRSLQEWRRHGMRQVGIGRDVVLDVPSFSLQGRRFRNVRQAVQRTRNAGVTTEVTVERELPEPLRRELQQVIRGAAKSESDRGFAMNLDHLLGSHPGTFIAYARDRTGRLVAFQRYATADGGRELSLDAPWRLPGAPNGVDERLIVDVVAWGAARGAARVSLTFAAFPDLFAARERSLRQRLAYRGLHVLDPFIRLESLYRFVSKFHALGEQRYVVLRPLQVGWVALAALSLEFGGTRKAGRSGHRLPWTGRRRSG